MINKSVDSVIENPDKLSLLTGEELFSIDSSVMDEIHLGGLNARLKALTSKLPALRNLAKENGIDNLAKINDIVPLLFPHTTYKSYPLALIEKCQFQQLNRWLDDYTTVDLSTLNVSDCESIDEWLSVIEANTSVRVVTSSGTSGKISLLPRSTQEEKLIPHSFSVIYGKYKKEAGLHDVFTDGIYHILPFNRVGPHSQNRTIQARIAYGFNGDESHVVSYGGAMSADVMWMTGRLKKAQADGTVEQLKKSKVWRRLSASIDNLSANKFNTEEQFFCHVLTELKGKTVVMALGYTYYWAMMQCAKKYKLEINFASDSVIAIAGGIKGVGDLNEDQIEEINATFDNAIQEIYGCSELIGLSKKCPHGHFHMEPSVVSFLLDPQNGHPYPREGIKTGRYAAFDLLPSTYWGGFITGDEVTMNWDGGCACGRNGPYIYENIIRYAEKNGGDDKITCQRTAVAVEEMMKQMNS